MVICTSVSIIIIPLYVLLLIINIYHSLVRYETIDVRVDLACRCGSTDQDSSDDDSLVDLDKLVPFLPRRPVKIPSLPRQPVKQENKKKRRRIIYTSDESDGDAKRSKISRPIIREVKEESESEIRQAAAMDQEYSLRIVPDDDELEEGEIRGEVKTEVKEE